MHFYSLAFTDTFTDKYWLLSEDFVFIILNKNYIAGIFYSSGFKCFAWILICIVSFLS